MLFRGLIAELEQDGMLQGVAEKAGRYLLARQVPLSLCAARLDGGRNPVGSRPGNRLHPAVDTKFSIDIAGVGFDRVQ